LTTIAYRDGIMACDAAWTYGETVTVLATKIYRLSSGAIMGQSGQNDGRPLIELFDKVKSAGQLPSYDAICALRVSATCLLVLPKGRIWKIATTLVHPDHWNEDFEENNPDGFGIWEEFGFAACGSGTDTALGAMASGKTAKEAVIAACKFDINSRPPVYTVHLKSPGGSLPR
jgi:hypothetical protein